MHDSWILSNDGLRQAARRTGLLLERAVLQGKRSCVRLERAHVQGLVALVRADREGISLAFDLPILGRVIIHVDRRGTNRAKLQIACEGDVTIWRAEIEPDGGGRRRRTA